LERVLGYLRDQSDPAFEVIIVDGPSDDGTRELLQHHADEVKLAYNPERNLSKSRNLGIELADGEVVAFIDDDALPFNDWIANILAEYNARPLTTAGLGGPAYYAGTFWFQAEDNGINRFAEAKVNIASNQIGQDGWFRYNTGTNATFATLALREHGGFDEQFDYYLDESEVCFRLQQAGLLIGYAPDVVVRHEFAQSHNRQGRLNYNWFTICKNTAYFIAAYSSLKGEALKMHIEQRMQLERIDGFDKALAEGHLTADDHARYVDAVRKGAAQGLSDAMHYPRRRPLKPAPGRFRPYAVEFQAPVAASEKSRLHVCIISREFPPFVAGGGVGTLYYHLASELLMMGHRVTAIVPGGELNIFKQGNMRVHFTPQAAVEVTGADGGFGRNIAWSVTAMARLAAVHEQDPVDIVDSALWDSEALAVALLPAHRRPKVVVRLVTPYALASQINGWQPDPATAALFMGAERALIAAADAVVPISESIAQSVEKTYGLHRDARWHLVPCGIAYWPFFDVNQGYNEFPELERLPAAVLASGRIVLFVGRLERRKGVDLILDAAPEILRSDPAAHIVLAGRDVEGWADRPLAAELQGRVHFVGEVDNGTREKLLARAWCLLFPSRYESFGLVPLEAFVHGVPVVAARAGAIPEVVQDGQSGLVFESESSLELSRCVMSLLVDPALRERLSAGARRRVRELGSRQSAVRSVQLYRNLLR
jgi:glycosyltransferase involved in cell wall biosynthesis